jgi:hypothetical protein
MLFDLSGEVTVDCWSSGAGESTQNFKRVNLSYLGYRHSIDVDYRLIVALELLSCPESENMGPHCLLGVDTHLAR